MINGFAPTVARHIIIFGGVVGMRYGASPALLRTSVALACVLGTPFAAHAQDISIIAPSPPATEQPQKPLTPEESALLGKVLLFNSADLGAAKAASLRLPSLTKPRNLSVNGGENPDGSSKVAVKQPVATDEWDASIGADLRTAATAPTTFAPGQPFPGTVEDRGSGAAWASVGVPNIAAVDARVDPTIDQSQVGAALKRAVPVGDKVSVTLQNRISVTDSYGTSVVAPAPLSDLPLMAAPKPTETATATAVSSQVLGTERSVKLDFKPTGTTFGAGFTTASNDPVTHNTLSADQQIYGHLHITTAVTDVGHPTSNKSITAGFKLDW
jgi:hypothetical protein